ncbi:cytochrome c family protein [Phaeobacter sp. QD34_3]|uniref:c-type cytochrome n=1 Tax=unclassified Phaeobacter TaxID=2621772 RepID=UPI00237F6A6C|nr:MULTISPECIES: cytochrome c family protein [unclassified Phaeobacter]MDE4132582.1 cytochrome c family protein [Phaeobacter sp. QD34_3]MDE4136218.1 cytochrome c family protein [Phaeobacter sp. QD34_24]MDE4174419.1 cytochrome c family protein [Phaeobacter sp. PT47_59]
MFDTMTLTKATAGVCSAFLVLLLGKWAAEELYHVESHGEASYVIEVEEAGGATEEAEEVSFEELLASADVGKGAKVFKKCAACHKLEDGVNATGPSLYGVVGRPKAAAAGFGYSGALAGMSGDWSAENLNAFLEKPSGYAPGTSMSFSGLKKVSDRVNLIAYLDSLDD